MIELQAGNRQWRVTRRFSQFACLDDTLRRSLAPLLMSQVVAPDKAIVRGLFIPPASLFDERVIMLNGYLQQLLACMPLCDDKIWGHPRLMEFFNLRLEESRLPQKGDLTALGWLNWAEHAAILEALLSEALETHRNRQTIRERRGSDVAHYVRLLGRQVEGGERLAADLEKCLEAQPVNDELWRERRIRLDRSLGELAFLRSTLLEPAALQESGMARPSLAVELTLAAPAPPKSFDEQQVLLKEQELGLAELADQAHRNRILAASLQEEVQLHNQILSELGDRIDESQQQVRQTSNQAREIR